MQRAAPAPLMQKAKSRIECAHMLVVAGPTAARLTPVSGARHAIVATE